MKHYVHILTVILIMLMVLTLISCDSDAVHDQGTDKYTAGKRVADADIPQNPPLIEAVSNAWSVTYLEAPDGYDPILLRLRTLEVTVYR